MHLVHAKYSRVAKRSKIVILMTPIPDNQVVVHKTHLFETTCQIAVEGIEPIFFADVHHHDTAVGVWSHHGVNFTEDLLQRVQELAIVADLPRSFASSP